MGGCPFPVLPGVPSAAPLTEPLTTSSARFGEVLLDNSAFPLEDPLMLPTLVLPESKLFELRGGVTAPEYCPTYVSSSSSSSAKLVLASADLALKFAPGFGPGAERERERLPEPDVAGPLPATVHFFVISQRTSSSKLACLPSGWVARLQPQRALYAAPSAAREGIGVEGVGAGVGVVVRSPFVVVLETEEVEAAVEASSTELGMNTGALKISPIKPTAEGKVDADPVAKTRRGRLEVS